VTSERQAALQGAPVAGGTGPQADSSHCCLPVGETSRGVTYSDLDDAAVMQWPLPFRPEPIPPFRPNEPPEGFE
jgi:hypothetical protein